MATELVVLLVACGIVTVLVLAFAVVALFLQTRRLTRTTVEIRDQLQPRVDAINGDVEVARHELERIQAAVEDIKASRPR